MAKPVIYPVDQASDWSHTLFQNIIRVMINERQSVTSGSTAAILDGHDIQSAAYIRAMQLAIENMASSFVATRESTFPYNSRTDFDGADEIELWTWDKIKTRVLGHDWTRKYPDGFGGTTTDYGYHRAGDYIGYWLWNEMIEVLCELVWIIGPASYLGRDTPTPVYGWDSFSYNSNISEVDAKSNAEAGYLAYTSTDRISTPFRLTSIRANGAPPSSYDARMESRWDYLYSDNIVSGLNKDVDLYIKSGNGPITLNFTFDNHGLSYIENEKYAIRSQYSLSSSDTSTPYSVVGFNPKQAITWATYGGTPGSYYSQGWWIEDELAIIKFNIPGGFTYY